MENKQQKKSKKSLIYIAIGLVGWLMILNPSESAHERKINQEMLKIAAPFKPSNSSAAMGWDLGSIMAQRAIINWAKRKNYIIFSTVEADNGKVLTFGILGMVFSNIK